MTDVRRLRAIALAIFGVVCIGPPQTAQARIIAQWVQLGPDGTSSTRAIVDDACPVAIFDGAPVQMSVRSEPAQKVDNVKPAEFPVRACEIAVPPGTVAATLDGKPLPLARPNPQRILMFGDTGCRIVGRVVQECND